MLFSPKIPKHLLSANYFIFYVALPLFTEAAQLIPSLVFLLETQLGVLTIKHPSQLRSHKLHFTPIMILLRSLSEHTPYFSLDQSLPPRAFPRHCLSSPADCRGSLRMVLYLADHVLGGVFHNCNEIHLCHCLSDILFSHQSGRPAWWQLCPPVYHSVPHIEHCHCIRQVLNNVY